LARHPKAFGQTGRARDYAASGPWGVPSISDTAGIRIPDAFVQLQLHPDIQLGIQEPFRKDTRIYLAEHGTQQHDEPRVEAMFADRPDGPVEVAP
jgi:hypothetical protein